MRSGRDDLPDPEMPEKLRSRGSATHQHHIEPGRPAIYFTVPDAQSGVRHRTDLDGRIDYPDAVCRRSP